MSPYPWLHCLAACPSGKVDCDGICISEDTCCQSDSSVGLQCPSGLFCDADGGTCGETGLGSAVDKISSCSVPFCGCRPVGTWFSASNSRRPPVVQDRDVCLQLGYAADNVELYIFALLLPGTANFNVGQFTHSSLTAPAIDSICTRPSAPLAHHATMLTLNAVRLHRLQPLHKGPAAMHSPEAHLISD